MDASTRDTYPVPKLTIGLGSKSVEQLARVFFCRLLVHDQLLS